MLQEARTRHDVQFWIDLARQFRPYVELCDTLLFREQFLPSSVDWYTGRCTIRSRDDASVNVAATEANFEQYNGRQFYLQPRDHSVYDGEGTGARYVVHVAMGGSGEVEIQYHFFYPFNGGFAIRDDLNEKLGTHEGDWEGIRVRVDVGKRRIRSVFFIAHGDVGEELTQSTEGDGDATHYKVRNGRPVVYAAWHSHASYSDLGTHFRTNPIDYTAGGRTWDGDVHVVAIEPELLTGEPLPEPKWLNWTGRWGSTRQRFADSWTSNSPDGPKISDSWIPKGEGGRWGVWQPISFNVRPDVAVRPSLIAVGRALVLAFSEPVTGSVRVASDQHDGGWSQTTPVGLLPNRVVPVGLELVVAGDGAILLIADAGSQGMFWTTTVRSGDITSWAGWEALPTPGGAATRFAASRDLQGRVHVLSTTSRHDLWDVMQIDPSSTSPWRTSFLGRGNTDFQNVVTTHQETGALVAMHAFDGQYQVLMWDGNNWIARGAPPSNFCFPWALARNADGRLEVFGINYDRRDVVQHSYEMGEAGSFVWSKWLDIGPGKPMLSLAAAHEANGLLALLAKGSDAGQPPVWFVRQSPDWKGWIPLGEQQFKQLCFTLDDRGRLWAVAVDSSGNFYENFETAPLS